MHNNKSALRVLQFFSIFIFSFLLLTTACLKSDLDPNPEPVLPVNKKAVTGSVIWPDGVTIDTTDLKVSSFRSASSINGGTYVADTINKFSTLFVARSNGDILLMRYNYPGQTDNDISAQSTALALLMNAPIAISLTDEGQLQMIQKIQKAPEFNALVQEVSKVIQGGNAISDTTNVALFHAIQKLFISAANSKGGANLRVSGESPIPLNIQTANPGTISIQNNMVAHKYVVGVYKDTIPERVEKLLVEGSQTFATSFSEILEGVFGDGYSSPDQQIFSTTKEGDYKFKIRSGKPGEDDNSKEYQEALNENAIFYAITLAFKHLPLMDAGCLSTMKTAIQNSILSNVALQRAKDPKQFTKIVIDQVSTILAVNNDIYKECVHLKKPDYKNRFMPALGKLFSFLGKVGEVGEAVNISAHIYDLYNYRAEIDTCFRVFDKKVTECFPIKLKGISITKYDSLGFMDIQCRDNYGGVTNYYANKNVYYLNFEFDDPKQLIKNDFTNIRVNLGSEGVCYRSETYYAPKVKNAEDIRYPIEASFVDDNQKIASFQVWFTEPGTSKVISNTIRLSVDR